MKTRKADCMCGTYDYKPHFKTDPHGSAVINKPQLPTSKASNVKPKAEHTPTPWSWRIGEDGSCVIESTVSDEVAIWNEGSRTGEPYHGIEANAAFIVRAVNSHEEMLAALKGIIVAQGGDPYAFSDKWQAVKKAIAKAEGR